MRYPHRTCRRLPHASGGLLACGKSAWPVPTQGYLAATQKVACSIPVTAVTYRCRRSALDTCTVACQRTLRNTTWSNGAAMLEIAGTYWFRGYSFTAVKDFIEHRFQKRPLLKKRLLSVVCMHVELFFKQSLLA